MKHLGDITKMTPFCTDPVDCITFGSPCQDLSIAGKRKGLKGERSGLFMEAVRIIKEMRCKSGGLCPTFAVWENVPGAFSGNGGEDFRVVLEELARIAEAEACIPRPEKGKWPATCPKKPPWAAFLMALVVSLWCGKQGTGRAPQCGPAR